MTKYIDAEKLKESLKRRYTDITVPVITSEGGLESYFRRREIRDIIKLIDSLQQEQPEVDLEEAAGNWAESHYKDSVSQQVCADDFIAGAKCQKEQMMNEWLEDRDGCFWDGVEEGKKAMKEQMMKESVEGYYAVTTVGHFAFFPDEPIKDLCCGDKVRVIIVKEDER